MAISIDKYLTMDKKIPKNDSEISVEYLRVNKILGNIDVEQSIISKELCTEKIKASIIEADTIIGEIKFEKNSPIAFSGDILYGKGLLWTGKGYTKQFIYNGSPDRFFSSESIDLGKDKFLSINNTKIIDSTEIGSSVTKSNLKEVGRLNGLIVDGSVLINNYIHFDKNSNRLGLGTEQPNSTISIYENSVEVMLGTKDDNKGIIGTFTNHGIDIVTNNTSRIIVGSDGNIMLGNPKTPPTQVTVHGKIAIRVNTPDPEVDLHVNGGIKFDGRSHRYSKTFPTVGIHNIGDIVWNNEPRNSSYVGWVCTKSGTPGTWLPFGKIGSQ